MPRWVPLALILFAFAACASWYGTVTPYRSGGILLNQRGADGQPARIPDVGAPDERQHANYVHHLLTTRSFPVLKPGSPDLGETYQSHQPPLYYLLAAGLGDPASPDGRATRYLNVLVGVLTLVGLFRLGKLLSRREEVGLACASFGLIPGFVMLHGAITNDPLLMCLCTWSLVFALTGLLSGWSVRLFALVGVLAGLALLTKSSAMALIPTLGVVWLLSVRQKAEPRVNSVQLGLGLIGLPLLIAAPWFARNASLYGDPLGLTVFKQAFTGSAQARMFIDSIGPIAYWSDWVLWWTTRSFVGVFGYMDIFLEGSLYLVMIGLGLLTLAGNLLKSPSQTEPPRANPNPVLWTFFVVVLVLFFQFNMTYFQGQARYLYPAIGVIAYWFGRGSFGWFSKWPSFAWVVPLVVLFGLNLYVLSVLPGEFEKRKGWVIGSALSLSNPFRVGSVGIRTPGQPPATLR